MCLRLESDITLRFGKGRIRITDLLYNASADLSRRVVPLPSAFSWLRSRADAYDGEYLTSKRLSSTRQVGLASERFLPELYSGRDDELKEHSRSF